MLLHLVISLPCCTLLALLVALHFIAFLTVGIEMGCNVGLKRKFSSSRKSGEKHSIFAKKAFLFQPLSVKSIRTTAKQAGSSLLNNFSMNSPSRYLVRPFCWGYSPKTGQAWADEHSSRSHGREPATNHRPLFWTMDFMNIGIAKLCLLWSLFNVFFCQTCILTNSALTHVLLLSFYCQCFILVQRKEVLLPSVKDGVCISAKIQD